MKLLATISNIVGTGLINTSVLTGSLSIPAFPSGCVLHIGMASYCMSILLPLINAASRSSSQLFAGKEEKHNSIKYLAQIKQH